MKSLKTVLTGCALTAIAACAAPQSPTGLVYAEPTFDKFGNLECEAPDAIAGTLPVLECQENDPPDDREPPDDRDPPDTRPPGTPPPPPPGGPGGFAPNPPSSGEPAG